MNRRTSTEMLESFKVSVEKLLEDIDKKYDELGKQRESETTFAHHTRRMILKWFGRNGGI